jgi:hypothetical protein
MVEDMVDVVILLILYFFASGAFLVALWMFLTIEELKENGKTWIKLNEQLLKKIEKLEESNKRHY